MTLTAIESQTSTQANNETRVGETRAPSRWGWPLAREITIIAVGLLLYRLVRLLAMGEIDTALLNSQRIVDWERALGIFNEVGLQSLVLGNDAIVWMLNRYYFLGHFLGMAMLLTWLYVAHYDYYGRVRRVLITLHGGRVDHPCELPVGTTALVSPARFCGHTPDLRSQDLRQRDDCQHRQPDRHDAITTCRLGAHRGLGNHPFDQEPLALARLCPSNRHDAGGCDHGQPLVA